MRVEISCMPVYLWTPLSPFVVGVWFLWGMIINYGCLSNTNVCQTSVTGVVVLITMTKTAIFGLKAKVLYQLISNSLVPIFVPRLLWLLANKWSLCRGTIKLRLALRRQLFLVELVGTRQWNRIPALHPRCCHSRRKLLF